MPEGVSRGTGAARREALRVRSAALKQRAANDADRIGIDGIPVLHWRIEGGPNAGFWQGGSTCLMPER
jgi:hypothetical protein